MRIRDYFALTGYVAKRNWKSLIVIIMMLICIITLVILAATVGYNIISIYQQIDEIAYSGEGGTLNMEISVRSSVEYDTVIARLLPYIIANIEGKWHASSNSFRCMIGDAKMDFAVLFDSDSDNSDSGNVYLSLADKMKIERSIGKRLSIGDTVELKLLKNINDGTESMFLPIIYAGQAQTSHMDISSLKGDYLMLDDGTAIGVNINFPATVSQSVLKRNINRFVDNLPSGIALRNVTNSLEVKDSNPTVAIIAMVFTILIIIIGMVSLSIVGSYLHMQIIKDCTLLALLRSAGMTKTRLALVEFAPLVAVIVFASIIATLVMLAFLDVVGDILGMLLGSTNQGELAFSIKYPHWIPLACGGAMLVMFLASIPVFIKKFKGKDIVKILNEKEVG